MYTRWHRAGAVEQEILNSLRSIGTAAQAQHVIRWLFRGLIAGMAGIALSLMASRWIPYTVPDILLLIVPVASMLIAGVIASFWRPSFRHLAASIDLKLGLQERARTAVELIENQGKSPLASEQLDDALIHVRRTSGNEVFPIQIARREAVVAAALLAVVATLFIVPNPMKSTIERRAAAQQVLSQEAEKLLKLSADLKTKESEELPEAQPGGLTDTLERLGEDFRKNTTDLESAISKLNEAEQQLMAMQNPAADRSAQAAQRAASALASEPLTKDIGDALQTGDLNQASQAMRALASANLSPEQRQQVAEALESAANDAGKLDPGIGQSLRDAANALRQGTQSDAQQALEQAADRLQATQQNAAAQEALRRALAQLQQSRNAIGQADAGMDQQQSAAAPPNQEGAGEGGQAPAEGQGQPQAQQGDSSNGEQSSGAGLGTDPNAQAGQVYVPNELSGQPDQLPGDPGEGPSNLEIDPNLNSPYANTAEANYTNVYASYRERALNGVDKGYIPLEMKDLVRDYFSSIAPDGLSGSSSSR